MNIFEYSNIHYTLICNHRGGAVKIFSQTMTELINESLTDVLEEQPLASPGSAKY